MQKIQPELDTSNKQVKTKLNRPNSVVDDAWLGLGNLDGVEIVNPLTHRSEDDIENPGRLELSLMRNPDYLSFACKTLLDVDIIPIQAVILEELWNRTFPMYVASRGFGKSFLMSVYCLLRMILYPNTKIVIAGAAFRQSRIIWEYMDTIWRNAPVLRSICDSSSGCTQGVDRCIVRINDSWSIAIPIGSGEKIRGLRANIIIADEFSSLNPHIYETVISGFAAVKGRPIDGVKEASRRKALKSLGKWSTEDEVHFKDVRGNQAIIAGTADYSFKHFAQYWERYKNIIKSKGDQSKISKAFAKDDQDEEVDKIDWKKYGIIRIPYELIPEGFMDSNVVARAKATMESKSIYLCEYAACFATDSDGFFKRSLIESCVTSENKPIHLPHSGPVWFDPVLTGNPSKKYVFGIDPAAERDNFSLIILELWPDHTRIVYGWSTNIEDFNRRRKAGLAEENDYYGFCARKIRNLMKVFPTEDIAMDAQGGGRAILEAFHDKDKLQEGEQFLWPTNKILNPDKELPGDYEAGRHIIHMCQFANSEFTSDANHGTRKDFEDKVLLFPRFDTLSLELSASMDAKIAEKLGTNKIYDSFEDCVMEIEELKNELSTIVMTRTGQGNNARDRWDTPEGTTTSGKKTRIRKDRYSALIMANYIARKIHRAPPSTVYEPIGGFTNQLQGRGKTLGNMYDGPEWFVKEANNSNCPFRAIKKQ